MAKNQGEGIMMKKVLTASALALLLGATPAFSETIKIGGVQPLTDWGAAEGHYIKNGAEIAVDRINSQGGINGNKIELIMEDGRNDPADSLNAVQKLIDRDKVSSIFGAWLSSASLAIQPATEKAGIPLIVETSGADELTYPDPKNPDAIQPHTFRTAVLFSQEAQAAKKALQELGVKKITFIAQDNDFGRGSVREMKKMMDGIGIKTGQEFYVDAAANDFYPQLTDIKNSDSDMIIVTHGNQGASKILEQKAELGVKQPVLCTGGSVWPHTIARLNGGKPTQGSYYLVFFAADHPDSAPNPEEAKYYVDEWKKRGLEWDGVQEGSRGYEAVMAIAEGIRKADGSGDPKAITEGLTKIDREGILGHIKFDAHHDITPNILVLRVDGENGEYSIPPELNSSPYLKK